MSDTSSVRVTLTVCLRLRGPILTQASTGQELGVDSPVFVGRRPLPASGASPAGAEELVYLLPYSLVRGKLREALEQLAPYSDLGLEGVDDLLGLGSDWRQGALDPWRGRIHISDFYCTSKAPAPGAARSETTVNIRIDPQRESVDHGALHVLAAPFKAGEKASFKGEVTFFGATAIEARSVAGTLIAGLQWMTSLGGERTVGFGRCEKVCVEVAESLVGAASLPLEVAGPEAETLELPITLVLREPFCVAKKRVRENLFESEEVIPGGVLKGAVATMLRQVCGFDRNREIDGSLPEPWSQLGASFSRLRFQHAFPCAEPALGQGPSRPSCPPLSLVQDRTERGWRDAVLEGGAFLLQTPLGEAQSSLQAPCFAIDWKDGARVKEAFGWPSLARELRVRTQIDRERRRAADEQLFAYETVVPLGAVWSSRISLRGGADVELSAVERGLRALFREGLWPIGKTKSRALVKLDQSGAPLWQSRAEPLAAETWVVTLQTQSLLCDPSTLHEGSGAEELHRSYQSSWDDLTGSSLELVRFFARQSLAGGYVGRRFSNGGAYRPFLLTEPGSVFLLRRRKDARRTSEQIADLMRLWLNQGLDHPTWVGGRYGSDWRSNPFVKENGFGEIAVNLSCHEEHRPKETEMKLVPVIPNRQAKSAAGATR